MQGLFFLDNRGIKRFIKTIADTEDVHREIVDYVKKLNPNFQIHYIRTWKNEDGDTQYDVGSHTEFFLLVDRCCATCSHFLGGGDFGTCCSKTYNLFYEHNICEDWKSKK